VVAKASVGRLADVPRLRPSTWEGSVLGDMVLELGARRWDGPSP